MVTVNLGKTSFTGKNIAKLIDKTHLLAVFKNPKLTQSDKVVIANKEMLNSLSNMSFWQKAKMAVKTLFSK